MDPKATKEDLYDRATELDIQGRSDMTKDELSRAIAEEEDGTPVAAAEAAEPDPLRHEPESTASKTGPVPPATVEGQAAQVGGGVKRDRRFGVPANRSAERLDRKANAAAERRREARAEAAEAEE